MFSSTRAEIILFGWISRNFSSPATYTIVKAGMKRNKAIRFTKASAERLERWAWNTGSSTQIKAITTIFGISAWLVEWV